jgi:hypothetical protein
MIQLSSYEAFLRLLEPVDLVASLIIIIVGLASHLALCPE